MKVKVFSFVVSNWTKHSAADDASRYGDVFTKAKNSLCSAEDVENTVNEFCEQHDVVGITVTAVDTQFHNNGRGNSVELWYTITYR